MNQSLCWRQGLSLSLDQDQERLLCIKDTEQIKNRELLLHSRCSVPSTPFQSLHSSRCGLVLSYKISDTCKNKYKPLPVWEGL